MKGVDKQFPSGGVPFRVRLGTAKDVLARLRWKDHVEDWSTVLVTIRHHGAPGDEKRISGSRISNLGTSFFEIDAETQIPYHRILRIERSGQPVYVRAASSSTKD